jgi:hypothetical protein
MKVALLKASQVPVANASAASPINVQHRFFMVFSWRVS